MRLPIPPYFRSKHVAIYHGDCIKLLANLKSECVDFVLTDPPYLVNYKGRWDGNKNVIVGDDDPNWLLPAYTEIYRVMKDNTFCVTFYGWPHADAFLGIWKKIGFRPISHLAFVKNHWGLGRFSRGQHETAFLLAKGKPAIPTNPISDVIFWTHVPRKIHPNQKPTTALHPVLQTFAPERAIVLDPFMGSGSTLKAASDLGMSAIGIEIDEVYCKKSHYQFLQGCLWDLLPDEPPSPFRYCLPKAP